MRTIVVANQKGGVGKTTTVRNLGEALARRGRSVLMVDLDSAQASLTIASGLTGSNAPKLSMAEVIGGAQPGSHALQDVIVKISDRLFLAPADVTLAGSEFGLVNRIGRETVLRQVLAPANFDYCLLDTSPSLSLLTINALGAANEVLVPIAPEYLALRGLTQLWRTIQEVQQAINPSLRVLGILITMYDERLRHAQDVIETLREQQLPGGRKLPVLRVTIRKTVRYAESSVAGLAIWDYDPGNPGAAEYESLAELVDGQTT